MKKATRRAISGLLAFVMVFGLIGPNLSISSIAQGDVDSPKAHVHNFTCYEDYWLDCDNTDSSHTHTLDCYAHSGELVCGFEKGEVHSHNQDGVECEFVTKILVCDVPEHEHDQSCVAESTDQNTGTDSNATDQSNTGEPSVDDGDQSSSIDQGNEDDPADTTADAGNSDSSGKDGPAEQDPDTSTIPDDSGSNVQEPDVPGTPDNSGSTDRNEDQIEDEVDVPGSGEENNSQAAVQEPQSNAGADETANEVEFSEIVDNEIPVDEFNAAGVEYICGQTEHLHTSSCYQEIWKCRKTASFSLTNTDYVVGFTPTVTNKLVASSSSKAFTFSITPETSDENVIMPEDTTVTINGSGTALFKEIGFNAAGSYTFDITEQASDDSSYFCDERHWTLTVDITEADGQFIAVGAYKQGETLSADGATFITTFTQPEGWSSSTLRQAKSIMDGMTLEEKVGQLFLLHYPGDGSGTAEQAKALIDKYHPGGYLVFDAMFANSTPDAVRSKIASAQSDSKIPMLFSVDEEGGTTASGRRIVRISSHSQYGHDPFRSPQELKAAGGLSAVAADTVDKANFLKDLGLNVNHAPVADVSGSTGYMYGRTYGGDGVENAEYVETVVANSDVNGVATTLKHFPGYGGTSSNTHNGFAENTLSWEEFLYNDLLPFRAGIAAGSHAVMVTHNTINCLDTENPASLSPAVYNMLRTEMNFDGVAMTDDLNMSAITNYVGSGKASLRALQAGADMAMTGIPDSDVPVVLAAAQDGSFPLADIEAKCLRVLCWKIEMGLIEKEVEKVVYTPEIDVTLPADFDGRTLSFTLKKSGSNNDAEIQGSTQVQLNESGKYKFGDIVFTSTGTYYFSVKMENDDKYLVTNHRWGAEWDFYVKVTRNSSGELSCTAYNSSSSKPAFKVIDASSCILYSPEFDVELPSGFDGRNLLFFLGRYNSGLDIMTQGETEIQVNQSGRYKLGNLICTEPGQYDFYISMRNDDKYILSAGNYTYWRFQIKVTQDDTGRLQYTVSNLYNSEPILKVLDSTIYPSFSPEIEVELPTNFNDAPLGFSLARSSAIVYQGNLPSINKSGKYKFGTFIFTKPGTYSFDIRLSDSGSSAKYIATCEGGKTVWVCKVVVSQVGDELQYTVSTTSGGPVFKVVERAAMPSYSPEIEVKLPSSFDGRTLSFYLQYLIGGPGYSTDLELPENRYVKVNKSGKYAFNSITFKSPGKYGIHIRMSTDDKYEAINNSTYDSYLDIDIDVVEQDGKLVCIPLNSEDLTFYVCNTAKYAGSQSYGIFDYTDSELDTVSFDTEVISGDAVFHGYYNQFWYSNNIYDNECSTRRGYTDPKFYVNDIGTVTNRIAPKQVESYHIFPQYYESSQSYEYNDDQTSIIKGNYHSTTSSYPNIGPLWGTEQPEFYILKISPEAFIKMVNNIKTEYPSVGTDDDAARCLTKIYGTKEVYNMLSSADQENALVQQAYTELCEKEKSLESWSSKYDDENVPQEIKDYLELRAKLPYYTNISFDNLSDTRNLYNAVMEAKNKISAENKNKYSDLFKYPPEENVGKVIQLEDNHSSGMTTFLDSVSKITLPSEELTENILSQFKAGVSNSDSCYQKLTTYERYTPSVKESFKTLEGYKPLQDDFSEALVFIDAVGNIDLDKQLVYEHYLKIKAAYQSTPNFNKPELAEFPFMAAPIEKYNRVANIVKTEENLSSAARAYICKVDESPKPNQMNPSAIEWLKEVTGEIDALAATLSGTDKNRVYVRHAMALADELKALLENESNLSDRANGFILSVEGITYSIPFTNESFSRFEQAVSDARDLHEKLSEHDKALVAVRETLRKLETLESVVDREKNPGETAMAFINAVNNIRMPEPPDHTAADTNAQIGTAYSKYNSLSQEDLRRLQVNNKKAELDNLIKQLEAYGGFSDTARQFIDMMNGIEIPDPVTSAFLNEISAKFNEIDRIYSQLADGDKEWFSVQKAIEKMNQLIALMDNKVHVHYDIQYYVNFTALNTLGGTTLKVIDTSGKNLPKNGTTNIPEMYMKIDTVGNPAVGTRGKIKTGNQLTQMYDTNNYDLVSEYNISDINKLKDQDGYKLAEIWTLKEGKDPASTNREDWDIRTDVESFILNPSEDIQNVISIGGTNADGSAKEGIVIRLVYNENNNKKDIPVNFYDYDISDGKIGSSNGKILVNSKANGINSQENYTSSGTKLTFGNSNTDVTGGTATWVDKYGISNTPNKANRNSGSYADCTFGLVTGLNDGKIQYASGISAPNLFVVGDAKGKTRYDDGEFSLEFDRYGDTYTLLSVKKGTERVIGNLDTFEALAKKWKPSTSHDPDIFVWSNSFWPMDYVSSWGGPNNDPVFGAKAGMVGNRGSSTAFPTSDDSKNHNPYFGMNYSIDFKVPSDYVGPLEYYFFGDDDLWIFLDNKLVCDIGGCHSSVGEYVNLWDYVPRGVESSHKLTVYYTERGASGSTCYMRYTIPTVSSVLDVGEATPMRYNPKVEKEVIGTESKDTFTFNIENIGTTDGVFMPSNNTCAIEGSGEGTFTMLSFTKPGTYQFRISEVNGNLPGYVYDSDSWVLTVKAIKSGNQICADSIEYSNSDGSVVRTQSAKFTNTYAANEASFTPRVIKEIRNFNLTGIGTEETFRFTILPMEYNEAVKTPSRMDTTIKGTGSAEFGTFRFTSEGTYRFMISETTGDAKGYEYDKSVWILTVTVTKDGDSLVATGEYKKDDGSVMSTEAATFVNSFGVGKLLPRTGGNGLYPVYIAAVGILVFGILFWIIRRRIIYA